MAAIVSLIVTLGLSVLVCRIAETALTLTGLSRASARFQARSAFSGVGYTTTESESIVNHPVRRQIAMMLMLMGNIGLATVAASVMVSFMDAKATENWPRNLSLIFGGLLGLIVLTRSKWVERRLNRIITWALRTFTDLDARDYVAVLNLEDGYAVTEMRIDPGDWLAETSLLELELPKEGVLVLGVHCSKTEQYFGAPTASHVINVGDTLVLYGPIDRLQELDQRSSGERGATAHQAAVDEHRAEVKRQISVSTDPAKT